MENKVSFHFSPNTIWLVAGFVLLCCVYYFWGWSRVLGDFGGDNAFYLLIAQYFSPWETPSGVAAYFFSHNLYPPLYPLVIALFGGGENLLAAHVITITLLLLAFIALYQWLNILGVEKAGAALITLLFALLPGTYIHALSILSENLFLLLTLICLASLSRFEADGRAGWLGLVVVSLAAATLTRSAGIALLAAFMLYLLVHRPIRGWPILALASMTPLILWNVFNPSESPGYLGSLISKYETDPFFTFFNHLKIESVLIASGWVSNFTASPIGIPVMAFAGLFVLMGMVQRVREGKLDGYYAAIYLLLILVWPYPAEVPRFVLVIIPVLLVQAWLLVDRFPRLKLSGRTLKVQYLLVFAIFLVVLPNLLLTVKRFNQDLPEDLLEYKRTRAWYVIDPGEARVNIAFEKNLTEHLESVHRLVPSGECFYSIKPSIISYYTGHVSVPPPRPQLDKASFEVSLGKPACRFFYMIGLPSPSYPIVYYPLERLRDSLDIVSVASPPIPGAGPVGILAVRTVR